MIKKVLFYINLIWLYPLTAVFYICSPSIHREHDFHGETGVWKEIKQAWRPK